MEIIYEDKDKIILKKEAGQLTQSGKNFDLDMVSEVMNYRKRKGEPSYAAVINRLDRPVSGVVLMAKNKESAARYSRIMQQQGFCKQYYALVYGKMEATKAVLSDYIEKTKDNTAVISGNGEAHMISNADGEAIADNNADITDEKNNAVTAGNRNKVSVADNKNAKFAELDYEVVSEAEIDGTEISLLKINLHTGRFHQIRIQLASRGHAIVGDGKYMSVCGEKHLNIEPVSGTALKKMGVKPREIALCAHSINVDGKEYSVTPQWWNTMLEIR